MCSNLLDVRETDTRVPLQCRLKHKLLGRRFENEWYTCIAIVGLCFFEMLSHSEAWSNLTRPSFKRHSLSHSSDHMLFDMAGHVPRNIPESPFPARLYIFDDNEAVIRMISNGRSPNLRHVSGTHSYDLDWLLE